MDVVPVLPKCVLPYVMFWNPIMQLLPSRTSEIGQVCSVENCVGSLVLKCWKIGQTHSLQPRILHTVEHTVLLVSALYSCSFGHEVSSIDPKFLMQISQDHIPFVLLHKTGFLKQFIQSMMSLVRQGMTFSSVEHFLIERREHFSNTIVMQIEGALQKCVFSNTHHIVAPASTLELIGKPIPSNDILCKCFVVEFLLNRDSYNLHMSSIAINKYISIDHTFKVASNIGYVRADGKWITLYNSLFIVMNEHGQVVSWQFTRTTSLDDVASQLESVKKLRSHFWLPPYTILVDNCCSQRPKLMKIFGDTSIIKLDIFHASQRITQKLPKRHPFYSACICDLKMVFRSPTDIGKLRTQNTPPPNILLEQLDNFLKK